MSQYRYRGLVCNIGRAERRQRLIFGVVFVQIAIVAFALLVAFDLDPLWRLLLIAPLMLGFTGIAQAYYQVCVGFDFVGKIDPEVAGDVPDYESAAFRRALRLRSIRLLTGTAVGAIILSAATLAVG